MKGKNTESDNTPVQNEAVGNETQNPNPPKQPKGRAGHSLNRLLCEDTETGHSKLITFGGWDGSRGPQGEEIGAENDLWLMDFDSNKNEFTWREVVLSNPPVARDCHTSTHTVFPPINLSISQREVAMETRDHYNWLVVFGGSDASFKYLGDTSILKLDGLCKPQPLALSALDQIFYHAKATIKSQGELEGFFNKMPPDLVDHIVCQLTLVVKSSKQPTLDEPETDMDRHLRRVMVALAGLQRMLRNHVQQEDQNPPDGAAVPPAQPRIRDFVRDMLDPAQPRNAEAVAAFDHVLAFLERRNGAPAEDEDEAQEEPDETTEETEEFTEDGDENDSGMQDSAPTTNADDRQPETDANKATQAENQTKPNEPAVGMDIEFLSEMLEYAKNLTKIRTQSSSTTTHTTTQTEETAPMELVDA